MRIRIRWSGWSPGGPESARLARFRGVLGSAFQTRGYGVRLAAVGFGTPEALARVSSVEEALGRLPFIPSLDWFGKPEDFENVRVRAALPRRFPYPFRPSPSVVFFDGSGLLPDLKPDETLAAAARVLCRCARRITAGEIPRPRIAHAMLSLAGKDGGYLGAGDRDLLWRAFRVPVLEQYLDAEGHVMAGECEAHEGLHLSAESGIFETRDGELFLTSLVSRRHPALRLGMGVSADIDTEICACGRPGPRVRNLRPLESPALACAAD